ncbi:MAG: efflux RND transporter periplasmic adaptor subunit [Deinococcales bacterium]
MPSSASSPATGPSWPRRGPNAAGGAARNDLDAARAAVDQAARQAGEAQLGLDTARARQTSFDALAAAQLAGGEATVRRLETAIANAEQQRTEAALVAPFAGVVAKVPIKVGDLIVSTTPQGVTVVDDSSVSVQADFDENRAVDLAAQQAATITPDAAPELALPAVVTRVDSVAERGGGSSATLRAELAFAPADGEPLPRGAVRPGYTVTAKVIVRRMPETLVVPLEAIGTDGADSYVFRVRQTDPGRGVAQRVPVEVADRNATLAAVRSADLAAGDRVAATNIDALEDGETVVFEAAGGGG